MPSQLRADTEPADHACGGTTLGQVRAAASEVTGSVKNGFEQIDKVHRILQEKGQRLPPGHLQCWVMLERPELFSKTALLKWFVDEAEQACRADPDLLNDNERYGGLIARLGAVEPCGPDLLRFLATRTAASMAYLRYRVAGTPVDPQGMVEPRPTESATDDLALLCSAITRHGQAIRETILGMANAGFAMTKGELRGMLESRRIHLASAVLRHLPKLMPEIEHRRGLFFPRGQSPKQSRRWPPRDATSQVFRGKPPLATGEPGAPLQWRVTGLATYLLKHHPGGYSQQDCANAVHRLRPQLGSAARTALVQKMEQAGLLRRDGTLLSLNDRLLCADAGQKVRAHRRPAPDQRRKAAKAIRAQYARQVEKLFATLRDLLQKNKLVDFTKTDQAGQQHFDIEKIFSLVIADCPTMNAKKVRDLISRISPARLPQVLDRAQWRKPAMAHDLLQTHITELMRQLPLLAFATHHDIAYWINERAPEHFCTAARLNKFVSRVGRNKLLARQAIGDLFDQGGMQLFMSQVSSSAVSTVCLRDHLAWQGIGITTKDLKALLAEHRHRIPPMTGEQLGRHVWNGALNKQGAAKAIMASLDLRQGSDLPPWDTYIAAFESEICPPDANGTSRLYNGRAAMEIFTALARELDPAGVIAAPGDTRMEIDHEQYGTLDELLATGFDIPGLEADHQARSEPGPELYFEPEPDLAPEPAPEPAPDPAPEQQPQINSVGIPPIEQLRRHLQQRAIASGPADTPGTRQVDAPTSPLVPAHEPAFSDACNAIAEVLRRPAPSDDFARWLAEAGAADGNVPRAIGGATVVAYLRDRYGRHLQDHYGRDMQDYSDEIPMLHPYDAGKSLMVAIESISRKLQPGAVLVLWHTDQRRLFTVRQEDGGLMAVAGNQAVRLDAVLVSLAVTSRWPMPVELYAI
ncbi:hypothetical protein [Xylophilus sp. GOD-11R]|uniref:hypothetical protein n=1 Tax=Xylophilus sp. GOD-11R TaxID=3089814 RepID=UPI00298CA3FB|nr:hypothetical protein [Xylophilus sp. GOD-11R]WPB56216.1 hypothetical protein R9X41_19035 [Xylophilus sp. GOD-11R]